MAGTEELHKERTGIADWDSQSHLQGCETGPIILEEDDRFSSGSSLPPGPPPPPPPKQQSSNPVGPQLQGGPGMVGRVCPSTEWCLFPPSSFLLSQGPPVHGCVRLLGICGLVRALLVPVKMGLPSRAILYSQEGVGPHHSGMPGMERAVEVHAGHPSLRQPVGNG